MKYLCLCVWLFHSTLYPAVMAIFMKTAEIHFCLMLNNILHTHTSMFEDMTSIARLHILTTVNSSATNTGGPGASRYSLPSLCIYQFVRLLDHMSNLLLVSKEICILFSTLHRQCIHVSISTHLHQHLLLPSFVVEIPRLTGGRCSLIVVWMLCIPSHMLAICIAPLKNCRLRFFNHF